MPREDSVDTFHDVIRCGIIASRALHSSHPEFPKEIDDLADIAERAASTSDGEFKIVFHPRQYRAKAILGKIESSGGSAHIYYDLDQNVCWRRFIAAKEIREYVFNANQVKSGNRL